MTCYSMGMKRLSFKEILVVAKRVRTGLINHYKDDTLMGYCCDASRILQRTLRRKGIKTRVVKGFYKIDDPAAYYGSDNPLDIPEAIHFWLEVRGKIVDITATQFWDAVKEEIPPVVHGEYKALSRYVVETKEPLRRRWSYKFANKTL